MGRPTRSSIRTVLGVGSILLASTLVLAHVTHWMNPAFSPASITAAGKDILSSCVQETVGGLPRLSLVLQPSYVGRPVMSTCWSNGFCKEYSALHHDPSDVLPATTQFANTCSNTATNSNTASCAGKGCGVRRYSCVVHGQTSGTVTYDVAVTTDAVDQCNATILASTATSSSPRHGPDPRIADSHISAGADPTSLLLSVHVQNAGDTGLQTVPSFTVHNANGLSVVFGNAGPCKGGSTPSIRCPAVSMDPGYDQTWQFPLTIVSGVAACGTNLSFDVSLNEGGNPRGVFLSTFACSSSSSSVQTHFSFSNDTLQTDLDIPTEPPAASDTFQEEVTVRNVLSATTPAESATLHTIFVDAYMGSDAPFVFDANLLPPDCEFMSENQVRCAADSSFTDGFTLSRGQAHTFTIPIAVPEGTSCGMYPNALWVNAHTTSISTPVVGSVTVACPEASSDSATETLPSSSAPSTDPLACIAPICASFCTTNAASVFSCKELCGNFPSDPFQYLCPSPSKLKSYHCTFVPDASCTYTCQ